MENNAETALAEACKETGGMIRNYTAAPLFASGGRKGHHQWLIEWDAPPKDLDNFAEILDRQLRTVNSDYDAKRSHSIFLDRLEVITAQSGLFDKWLKTVGNLKLGGQRKVPRLSNDRHIIDALLALNG